jgi:hypothetical protein
MDHADRIFLLSLTASLACGTDTPTPSEETEGTTDGTGPGMSTTSGSTVSPTGTATTSTDPGTTEGGSETTGDDGTSSSATATATDGTTTTASDSSSEDGGDSTTAAVECGAGAGGPLVEACCAWVGLYEVCYGYAAPPGYCEDYAEAIEMYYGAECAAASADILACLSTLECGVFMDAIPPECQETALESHQVCPELIWLCSSGSGGGGPTECEAEATDCLDGHTYAVMCDTDTCTCLLDGDAAGTFAGDPDSCLAPGFDADVVANCGFPPGLFGF